MSKVITVGMIVGMFNDLIERDYNEEVSHNNEAQLVYYEYDNKEVQENEE